MPFELRVVFVVRSIVFFCSPVFIIPAPGFSYEPKNCFDTSLICPGSCSDNRIPSLRLNYQIDSFAPTSP